jgi:hypothetical protein
MMSAGMLGGNSGSFYGLMQQPQNGMMEMQQQYQQQYQLQMQQQQQVIYSYYSINDSSL